MRAGVLVAAAMLASGGTASAGGYGAHASGHVAGVARTTAPTGVAGFAPARGPRGSAVPFARSSGAPYGHALRGYEGYGRRSYAYGGYGYGYGGGYGLGGYGGYGLGDALETDTGGYDEEGLQSYGPPAYPPPPYLAPAGYGPGPGNYRGAYASVNGVHVSGEGVYAYGYYGHATTPALPYGVYSSGGAYYAPAVQPPQSGAAFAPPATYGPACSC